MINMSSTPSRTARIVLVTPDGNLLGALPSVRVATPWWQDIEPVVRAVREHHGVEIKVLRLLSADRPQQPGGEVTYLAETTSPVAAEPWSGRLEDHPLRLAYARPGGPSADLAWAENVLSGHGFIRVRPAVQVRTWNLSSLWRIPVQEQTLWLKVVPPFFSHEGAVLQALSGGPVPTLLSRDGCRMLMPEIPGEDLYHAEERQLLPMVGLLINLQHDWIGRIDELFRLGLPDWRSPALTEAINVVIARNSAQLTSADRSTLAGFAAALPSRFADIAACGIPDTLVHGDFHPGNLRGDQDKLTILDWGDCGVGNPLLDQPAFLERVPAGSLENMRHRWSDGWKTVMPGSNPARASILLAPIAAARRAVIYQGFLDQIEPSEHPYHRADPLDQLERTAVLVRAEGN
jgi:hypothetical protein